MTDLAPIDPIVPSPQALKPEKIKKEKPGYNIIITKSGKQ